MDLVHSYLANTPPPENAAELKGHEEIPVHIHIPKCGGTFIRRTLSELLRLYCLAVHKIIPVKRGAVILIGDCPDSILPHAGSAQTGITAYCVIQKNDYTPPKPPGTEADTMLYRMPVEDFIESIKNGSLDVFSISVTSVLLMRKRANDLEKIERSLKLKYFVSLRAPFERANSLYFVHKKRHPDLPCFSEAPPSLQEFEKFLLSEYSEPNWVSCFLAYVFNSKTGGVANAPMSEEVFKSLAQVMSTVATIPMSSIGKGLRDLFSEVYSPYIGNLALEIESQAPDEYFNRGHNKKAYNQNNINANCLNYFNTANSYDIELYNSHGHTAKPQKLLYDSQWRTRYTVTELNKLMESGMSLEQIFEDERSTPLADRTW